TGGATSRREGSMAVRGDATKIKLFEALFEQPSLGTMHALSPADFEHFVGYVFRSAGYGAEHVGEQYLPERAGLDFNLYANQIGDQLVGAPIARVEVRRYAKTNLITLDAVMSVIGRLHVNEDVPGFVVTTSDFYPAAREAARRMPRLLHLIDGEHLLR